MRLIWKKTATVGMAVAMAFACAGAAQANTADSSQAEPAAVSVLKYRDGECQMKSDTPHWSRAAGSVIFKTRVECVGTEAPVVRITGDTFFVEGGLPGVPSDAPTRPVAHSSEDQVVPIGETKTWYTPVADAEKLTTAGTYQGVASGEVVAPVHSNLNTFTTARSFVLPLL